MAAPHVWTYESFIKVKDEFDLGDLDTEKRHHLSGDLSEWCIKNKPIALDALKAIDILALQKINLEDTFIEALRTDCHQTWQNGGRVFIIGCGSTGRMAFILEKLANNQRPQSTVAVMAAGDIALVHSVAGFEDSQEFGAKQLFEAGFKPNDLLIACTEGGETPYVLGTLNEATKISKNKSYFVFCNPISVLTKKIKRSKQAIENPKVVSIELSVGPMALTGSTRLQATTVQSLVVGWALLNTTSKFIDYKNSVLDELKKIDFKNLSPLVETEIKLLKAHKTVIYKSRSLPMAVFTDIAERGPTFSLLPLQPIQAKVSVLPQFFVHVPQTQNASEAWRHIFGRQATWLGWKNLETSKHLEDKHILSFDWSEAGINKLTELNEAIKLNDQTITVEFDANKSELQLSGGGKNVSYTLKNSNDHLMLNLMIKMILNAHSTVVMGGLERFHKNLMTFVRPTNGKLIDRSRRYVKWLLEDNGIEADDNEILKTLFARLEADSTANQSVVVNTYLQLKKNSGS